MDCGDVLVFQNGAELKSVPVSLAFDNSAFKWGSSVFTTALVENGVMPFFKDHLERLCRGSEWLWKERFSESRLEKIFLKLSHLKLKGDYILRFTLFKDSQGKTTDLLMIKKLTDFSDGISLQTKALEQPMNNRPINIKIGCYADRMRGMNKGSLEPLFIDELGNYLEASYFNVIFKFKNGDLKSPLIQKGALLGIGISRGLEGADINFTTIHKSEIYDIDCIFLVNSLRGLMETISLDGAGLQTNERELSRLRKIFDLNKVKSGYKLWQAES